MDRLLQTSVLSAAVWVLGRWAPAWGSSRYQFLCVCTSHAHGRDSVGRGSHRPHVGTAPGEAAFNGEVGHRGKEERPREQSRVRVGGGGGSPPRRAIMLPPVTLFP